MNGYKLLEQAVRLLGRQQLDENLKIIGLTLLSAVAEEMGYAMPESLSEKVPFVGQSERMTALYGLAMLIANASGETDMRAAFSQEYNRRLSAVKGRRVVVKDRIFRGDEL